MKEWGPSGYRWRPFLVSKSVYTSHNDADTYPYFLDIPIQGTVVHIQICTNLLACSLPMDLHILTCSVSLRATLPHVSVSTSGTPTRSLQLTCASSTSSLRRAQTHHSHSLPTYTITAGLIVCGYNALTLCQHSWMYLMRYRSNCPHVTRHIWAKYLDCTFLNSIKGN